MATTPKPFIFVIMPFSPDFDDIYNIGIKTACEEAGAYSERVDEQLFGGRILDRIYNQISKADVIISDMTGRNPSVFYETGYAHALGKKVLLLTQNADDIPFDLEPYPHVVYGGRIEVLRNELVKRVRWAIQRPDDKLLQYQRIQVSIKGSILPNSLPMPCKVIDHTVEYDSDDNATKYECQLLLEVDVHNSIMKETEIVLFEIGIIGEKSLLREVRTHRTGFNRSISGFPEDANSILFLDSSKIKLLPGSWHSGRFSLTLTSQKPIPKGFLGSLRIISKQGPENFPFELELDLGLPRRVRPRLE